ncbi:Sodium: neurotransmitter symporter family protein [Colletotrichum karsti]|uniref:Sodium: neurotransmitter symporter family protein n=1 Tax=Colletotrichum karsti TaxID=1095194 RepID=A0A9P6I541_9PEZI|nr:Sodium: neurotransmitter symporter family protein [Colletotrichum karsti]KAF9872155.1 Sodium: neurotransmitter symporter family protein [Colletotrichum karsti]
MVNIASKVYNWLAPSANKGEDGRDVWGSRLSFIFAAMGGAVGLGNLLRFPSIVYNNHGLQFFIPYLISLFCLAIPTLLLEISIGQAYRGGCVLAWHHAHQRAKGVGFGVVYIGYAICIYYVPIIAWIMSYFRHSFISPLPWMGRNEDFFYNDVLQDVPPIAGNVTADGSRVQDYSDYAGMGMNTEITLWNLFTWFVVWLCMFKGIGLTGRVVYFTMAMPIILMIVLIGRGCSLPNAIDGIRIYWTEWHGSKLASGTIWQEACGQVFFSTGIGMGYYTSYASYNHKYSNAVQDALIICISNSLIEVIGSMSVFGVVGYLGMHPDTSERLNTFVVGFLTYPEAIAEMPGANFWGVLFFATLFILGLGSAFALLETLVTMVCDTDWGKKYPRPYVSTIIVVASFLISLPFCTEFGYSLVDAADTWINYLALFWIVWCEAVCATTLYRYRDVVDQCGLASWCLYNIFGYIGGTVVGLIVAHAVSPDTGAGVGFGMFIVGIIASVMMGSDPTAYCPRFFSKSPCLRKLWYLSSYSGNQLRRDLNATISTGGQWKIPAIWAFVLKYNTAPIVSIIFSFAYPNFYATKRWDPLHIAGFTFMHVVLVASLVGLVMPRWFNVLVPTSKRTQGNYPIMPGVIFSRANATGSLDIDGVTPGPGGSGSDEQEHRGERMWHDEASQEKVAVKRQRAGTSMS